MSHVQDALEAAGIGLWTWTLDGDTVQWSGATASLFGRPEGSSPDGVEEFMGWLHPDDREGVDIAIRSATANAHEMGTPGSFCVEHRVNLPGGGSRWLECRGSVATDSRGQAVRMDGTSVDCTARKLAEAELVRRDEIASLQTQLIPGYLYVVELEREGMEPVILSGASAFQRITGFSPSDVAARGGWIQVLHPDDRTGAAGVLESVMRGEPGVAQYRIVDVDGQVRWLRDHMRPELDEDTGTPVRLYGSVTEVTEQMGLQAQLIDARRHEALARFSGGVAHDFNNLITVIAASADLMDEGTLTPENLQNVRAIRSAVDRASELTRGMLLFARRSSGRPRVVSTQDVVEQAEAMLRQALGIERELRVSAPDAPLWVRIDPAQAQLLLLNLVVNARHATPEAGAVDLRLEMRDLALDDPNRPPELTPGPYVAIEVRDRGVGIDPSVLPRIFEPYFTTRGPGDGTGLGLSACQGIAGQAGGAIQVASEPGKGATFTVLLPPAAGDQRAPVDRSMLVHASGGTERLLLVEDEPVLRLLFDKALTGRGYVVTTCEDAESALERLDSEEFDILVSDIVMPGIGGLVLAERVSELFPDLPILLISGNLDGAQHGYPFLPKPMTPSGLARRVRELLDAPVEGPAG